jgi:hypothetical protein
LDFGVMRALLQLAIADIESLRIHSPPFRALVLLKKY